MDAVDGTDVDARAVFDVDARLGDDVRHGGECSDPAPAKLRRSFGQLGDELRAPLDERRLDDDLVEAGRVGALEPRLVRVVRVAEDRHVRPGVDYLVGLDARDVDDDEIRRVDAVARDQMVVRQQPFELAPEEEVDPCEQDRRHGPNLTLRGRALLAQPDRLEEAIEVDAQAPELAGEEERAERDEDDPAHHLDRDVVVAHAAEEAHRRREQGGGDEKGHGQPERVDGEQQRASSTVSESPARTRIEPRTGPMQGAAQTAKAPPSRKPEPRRRAPWTRPAPTSRSGQGRSPMKTSPNTIRTKPATCSSRNWLRVIESPTAAAPAPSRTKTETSPATKGRLETTTRRAAPGSPRRSASTDETAER